MKNYTNRDLHPIDFLGKQTEAMQKTCNPFFQWPDLEKEQEAETWNPKRA